MKVQILLPAPNEMISTLLESSFFMRTVFDRFFVRFCIERPYQTKKRKSKYSLKNSYIFYMIVSEEKAMLINTENMMSITDVNHNFSKAVKAVEKNGELVILKQNKPLYMLLDLERFPQFEMSDDEKVMFVGQRILKNHINAFKELAK